jgi:tetratricopeptide (TPR) repeat protein
MICYARSVVVSLGLACVTAVSPVSAMAQNPAPTPAASDRATSYYTFAMAHLYAELAQAYGNRGEYVNKAIDMYRQAMKLDPGSSYIGEELADFYVQTSQLERATQLANELIKANPNNASAHKVLARIYARQIGDPGQGKIDQAMLKSALEEYQKITGIDPRDQESLSMLARLYAVSHDMDGAEKTYKAILAIDPNDDDALTGLANVYADKGDIAGAISTLKQAAEQNPDATKVTALAELYEQDKQFSNAADAWKAALPLTNDNATVRRHYALMLEAANRTDEALKAVQDLVADDPKNPELQLELAGIYQRKKDFVNAHAALAKVKAVNNSPEVRMAEADLLASEGKPLEAIAVIEEVLSSTKKSNYNEQDRATRIEYITVLAERQKEAGRTQDAVSSLRQISELNPSAAPKVEVNVVELLLQARDLKGARQTADAALKKFSGDRAVALEHASLLSQLGDFDASIKEFRGLSDSGKDRDVLLFISQVQDKAKRFADESKTLDTIEALSTTPTEKQAVVFQRGAMFERQKNYDAAEQQFRKVIAADPKNAGALNYLGYMFADRGIRLDEAQKMISQALDLSPGNGAFLDSLGWVYFRMNKLDQAAEELRKALDDKGTSDDPTVHDHLAEVYFKQGKVREAVQQWETAITGFKAALPSDQDPEELAKITHKLESAKVKVSEKQ